MTNPAKELRKLSNEVQDISIEIASLKSKRNSLPEGDEKCRLNNMVKLKQYQALFYISKIENISKHLKTK